MTAVKVAILTQPLAHNYGGLLQAYALQHYLKSLGCEVQTIDRRVSAQPGPTIIDQLCNLMRLALGRIKSMPTKARDAEMWRKLAAFRDTHLSISPELMSEEALRQYFQNVDFDAVVVGSDQVWRPRYSPSLLNFYLNFLNDINSPAKRLAYAASFGVDDWEYPDELSDACWRAGKTLRCRFSSGEIGGCVVSGQVRRFCAVGCRPDVPARHRGL
ncbi:MAG: polysaccharide pyruvyl transferase family protein [Polymorphobacter sp.]|uniref:polysaccharide pyruvyl transferase family protein n=1 Tax=Polymorphobacter sp. TaxID=1909290 RepID=UPI003A88D012